MMTTDKRTVSTDALETLGFLIGEGEGRDAIHLAVEPAIAVGTLRPGQHVGFVKGGVGESDNPIGIVDPFLTDNVREGRRFWLIVYPRTITSLRHVWSHPAFPEAVSPLEAPSEAAMSESERWLRNYAKHIDETYDALMAGADRWVRSGDYFYGAPTGDPGDTYYGNLEGMSTSPDFWRHYEAVRNAIVPEDRRRNFFTCSC